jgi:protein O-GlcNAc transferase
VTFAVLLLLLASAPPQPGGAAAAFQRAAAALSAGDYAAAEKGFQEVLKLEPTSVPALGNLGVTYSRQERFSEAVGVYRKALKLAPNEPGLLLNLAIAYVKQEQYAGAKPLLARLPRNNQTRELLATCELFTGNPARALELLDGLHTPEALFLTGTARLRLKQPDPARAAFAELLASTSPAQAHMLMGRAYLDNGQFDESIAEFRQALDLPAARLELAKAQISIRDSEAAEKNLREFLQARPGYPEAVYYLGALLVLMAREDEALPLLEQARAARPDSWGAYYYLGRAYLQKGSAEKALALLERSARLNPDEAAVWFQLARACQTLGRGAEAAKARERFNAIREKSLEASQPVMPPNR